MGINFKEALATISRALPLILLRAGIFVAGGFMVIILFGMLLFLSRITGDASPVVFIIVILLVVLGWWVSGRILQRFFLYRYRAAMLLMFSGRQTAVLGLSQALGEVAHFFPDYSTWAALKRSLRRFFTVAYHDSDELTIPPDAHTGMIDLLTAGPLSHAVIALAFMRGGTDTRRSIQEGLALYSQYGTESRHLARQWLGFSAAGLVFLFLCLALPNWFFFKSAGAPVWIGIVLAAAIAWLLHQAFIVPFVLAGVCGVLLAETSGRNPDQSLCEKLVSLIPDTTLPDKRSD